jgi:hypothetical protein
VATIAELDAQIEQLQKILWSGVARLDYSDQSGATYKSNSEIRIALNDLISTRDQLIANLTASQAQGPRRWFRATVSKGLC